MGIRGELFTTQVTLDNRAYFFNVKENRAGDVFLQIVESKNKTGEEFDRRSIVIFEEDMQKFFRGLDSSIQFIEKNTTVKKRAAAEKEKKYSEGRKKEVIRKKIDEKNSVKRTGVVRVVSKRSSNTE
ncbi:MAG: DUF3276 family protein [Treponemataceae bacterium]